MVSDATRAIDATPAEIEQIRAMSDADLLANLNGFDPYDDEFRRRYTTLAARVAELEADLARLAVAAGELFDLMDRPDQSDGKIGRYHYDWHKVDAALACFRAIAEGKK